MQTQINGNEVFYTTNGQGRPMLLMHGGSGLDHTYFRPWLDTLSDQVQLIYYDQLGQGRSTRPQSYEGISMDTWADEADALRASLGFDRIILFGHSFGGFIAQEYALRHGEYLDGLVLCEQPCIVRTVASENKGVEELAATVARFRKHFESSGERKRKHVEHWKNRLIELLQSRLLERALGGVGGEARLAELAAEVAERKKDPFTAVNEILKVSGLAERST